MQRYNLHKANTLTIKISDHILLLRYTSDEVRRSNPGRDINHAEYFRGFHEASSRTGIRSKSRVLLHHT
jgi:hypothetical protein